MHKIFIGIVLGAVTGLGVAILLHPREQLIFATAAPLLLPALSQEPGAVSESLPDAQLSPELEILEHSELKNEIVVLSQDAGAAVHITATGFSKKFWLAVHEVSDDHIEQVVGTLRVEPNTTAVAIPLMQDTASRGEYAVILYENTDESPFSFTKNRPYVDQKTGLLKITRFTTL